MKYNGSPIRSIPIKAELSWEDIAKELWGLLDNIDTASDALHPAKNNFYEYVMKESEKRHQYLKSDGYKLIKRQAEE